MGGAISHANNKLSFSFDNYIDDRLDLADAFREIAKVAKEHRETKGTLQVINGASGVTAGIAGAVALILSPVTLGLSVPTAAVVTTAIVGNSLAAASLTSSVASYGYGQAGDDDIVRRLHNLQCVMTSVGRKDEQVNTLVKTMEKDNVEPVVKACRQLQNHDAVGGGADTSGRDNKLPVHLDLPLSVMKTQGIFLGANSIVQGAKQVRQEEKLEMALTMAAAALDEETATIRTLENQFKHLCCIPSERELPRGRLTIIDGGGGGSAVMVATLLDSKTQENVTFKSDSSNVLRLAEGALSVKVHFELRNGTTVKKIDRSDPKQPWIRIDNEYQVDVFDFDSGDGVDAVFVLQGRTLGHVFVAKAWNFGREPWSSPRSWEWWENPESECKELLPDLDARIKRRKASLDREPFCGMNFGCGSCFGNAAISSLET